MDKSFPEIHSFLHFNFDVYHNNLQTYHNNLQTSNRAYRSAFLCVDFQRKQASYQHVSNCVMIWYHLGADSCLQKEHFFLATPLH